MKRPLIAILTITAAVMATLAFTLTAQSPPQPALAIQPSGTNVLITVTNGVPTANYEVYRRRLLDTNFFWSLSITGAPGQTSFVAEVGVTNMSFFLVGMGNDWDGDGINNFMDANPTNASVRGLAITIESPTNGAVFN